MTIPMPFPFSSPAPAGEVSAKQTEGVFRGGAGETSPAQASTMNHSIKAPMICLLGLISLVHAGCGRPLHASMSFGEIRTTIRSEIAIGMDDHETIVGLKKLRLSPRVNYGEQTQSKPYIVATVPPKHLASPLDWARSSDGQLRFYFDMNDQLRSVMYLAPFRDRKQTGGWWSDDPVLIIGETP